MKFQAITTSVAVLAAAAVLVGAEPKHDAHHHHGPAVTNATAVFIPTQGNNVHGTLTLQQSGDAVMITGEITGLSPGEHGFHIHEFGDITDPAGKSAGGHYNPGGHPHGGPDSAERHAGDLGNVTANGQGTAVVNVKAPQLQLSQIIGRSFVVHGGVDDLKSQPAGDAGPRVGVAIVGIAGGK
jgi:Cu-Zn family superoxide dismutase